ncbi:MAG: recombination mediator RecR [Mariprofundaceae bacterium]
MIDSLPGVPAPLARLVEALSAFPGIGPKSAMRLGLHLLQKPEADAHHLADALLALHRDMGFCKQCGAFAEKQHCRTCEDSRRKSGIVCVVEQPVDVLMLERSHTFSGQYHVLHGRLSPVDGIGPDELNLAALDRRMATRSVAELILATSATVDGEATAHFIARRFQSESIRVSRIARGVPEGGELEYLDEHTLSRALDQRILWE